MFSPNNKNLEMCEAIETLYEHDPEHPYVLHGASSVVWGHTCWGKSEGLRGRPWRDEPTRRDFQRLLHMHRIPFAALMLSLYYAFDYVNNVWKLMAMKTFGEVWQSHLLSHLVDKTWDLPKSIRTSCCQLNKVYTSSSTLTVQKLTFVCTPMKFACTG